MPAYPLITHAFNFGDLNDKMRPYLMAEFAANGETNLVLNSDFIRDIIRSPGFAAVLRKDSESAGITFADAHAPFGTLEDLNLPFQDLRPAMLLRAKLALEIAASFDAGNITFHVGNAPKAFAEYTLDDLQACAIRSLEELLPIAERLGITIAIENSWVPTATPERLIGIVQHFNSNNLGLCYDTGHANLMTKDLGLEDSNAIREWKGFGKIPYDAKILEKMLPYVTTCHLHDNDGLGDYHRLPGEGTIDWPHIMGLLKTAPRLKYYHNEVSLLGTGTSIAKASRFFRELVGVACHAKR